MKTFKLNKSDRSFTALLSGAALLAQFLKPARAVAALAAAMFLLAAAPAAWAATYTWVPTAATGGTGWPTVANWSPTGFPNGVGDIAQMNIDILGNQTVNLNQSITLGEFIVGDSNGAQTTLLQRNAAGALVFDQPGTAMAYLTRTAGGTGTITFNNTLVTFTLNDDLTVRLAGGSASSTISIAAIVSGAGSLTKDGTTLTLTLTGANTYSGGTFIKNGTLNGGTSDTCLGTGNVTMGGSGSTGATFITGRSPANAFTINAPDSGTIIIGNSGINNNGNIVGPITLNGNLTLQTLGGGNGSITVSGGITGSGSLILNNQGSGGSTINLSGSDINPAGSITLQGASTGPTTISANLGANVTGITQNSASSTLSLSGANPAFAGSVAVNAGTLDLASASALSGASALTVADGATLSLSTGPSTVPKLTFANTGTMSFNVSAGGALTVAAANGITNNGAVGSVTINITGSAPADGTYTLITYSGSLRGSGFSAYKFGTGPAGKTYALVNAAGTVQLAVSTLLFSWTGAQSGEWSTNTISPLKNWSFLGNPADYTNGFAVVFDDSVGGGSTTVDISSNDVTPLSVGFDNNVTYTLQGSKGIAGSTALVLSGAGTVAILNTNTYTGSTLISAGTLQLGDGTSSHDGTIANSPSVVNNSALVYNRFGSVAQSGVISGTGTLTMSGTGTQTLSGANTYSGATTVSGGELDLSNWGGTPLGAVTVSGTSGATLGLSGSATYNLSGSSFFVASGAGSSGTVNQTGGTVTFTSGNALLVGNGAGSGSSGTYNLSSGTLSSFASTTRGVMLGANSTCSATFNLSGAGNLSLGTGELAVGRNDAASTDCTVAYNQTGGAATVGYLSVGGQSASTGTAATFSLTGGTFAATNFQNLAAAASSSATLTLGGSAQVTLPAFPVPAGTANLTFDFTSGWLAPQAASGAYLGGLSTANLTANGANFNVGSGKDITVAQGFQNAPAQTGVLRKTGSGTLTLAGANTYTGSTTISAGTLEFSTAGSATTPITVAGGATNGVLVTSANGQWVDTGSLTNSNSSGVEINFGIVAPSTTVAPIKVNNLSLGTGLTLRMSGSGFIVGQSYPLITWTGSGPASAGAFTTVIPPYRTTGALTVSGSTLNFNVTGTTGPLSWNTGNGTWNTSTPNWVDATLAAATYADSLDLVFFDDASGATGNPTITLTNTLAPVSVTMNSTSHDYALTGAGGIGGTGPLILAAANTRTLTLSNANTYTGPTTIGGGTLAISGAGWLGSLGTYAGDISIASGATLQYSGNNAQTLSGTLTGSGSLTMNTSSNVTLTLSGAANTHSGPTTINMGRLQCSTAGALSPNTAITINGNSSVGGQFLGGANLTIANNFTISGVGFADSITTPNTGRAGAIRVSNGESFTGTITLAGDSRIGFIQQGTGSATVSGRITGNYAIDFYGACGGGSPNNATQTFTLANTGTANDYTGSTSITSIDFNGAHTGDKAILQLGASDQIPNGPGKGNFVFNGVAPDHITYLELNGFNETINGLSAADAAGAVIQNIAAGTSTLMIGDANTTSAFSGLITDGGAGSGTYLALTKIGAGTLTLTGENTYNGDTIISGGTLLVNNSTGSGTGTGAVTVNSGGTLGGTGAIAGVVTNKAGGTLSPGASIGTLTINGDLTLEAGSTNTFEVNGSTPTNDVVVLGAAVTYGGVLKIVPTGNFTIGQTFQLFSGAGATSASNFGSLVVSPSGGVSFTFTNGVLTVLSTGFPQPTIAPVTVSGTNLVVSVPTVLGGNYVLQSTTNLTPTINWQNESTNAGTGGNLILNVPIEPDKPQKFVRFWVY